MPKPSPTQRTLAEMRKRGYTCEVVEHWNPHARVRKDLYGFIDVLCLGDGEVIGVQATSLSNVSARVRKIVEHENLIAVREAGIIILVHGWNGTKLKEVDCSQRGVQRGCAEIIRIRHNDKMDSMENAK